nr:hypothetical protein [uncultured Sphingosinicella sp.]
MEWRNKWHALEQMPAVRTALCILGCLLLLITPFLGVLPGPGGLFTFAAGAALVLKYSEWAKRKYVLLKRRYPKQGAWVDWGLRRCSARRREEKRKRLEARCAAEAARKRELARLDRDDGEAKLVLVRHEIGVAYFIERRFTPDGPFEHEAYWAAVGFSRLYADFEQARHEGLKQLERA